MALFIYSYTAGAGYQVKWLADTTPYRSNTTTYNFSNSVGFLHGLADLNPLTITTATCAANTCTVAVSIADPTFDAAGRTGGLYGDVGATAQQLIAGYKIFAYYDAGGATPPASGLASAWLKAVATGGYIPRANLSTGNSTGTITVDVTGAVAADRLYLAYAPVYNYTGSGCNVPCTAGAVQTIATRAQFANAPMFGRVVSEASVPINPTPTTFESFTAHYADLQHVSLAWETASETDAIGFNLYRSIDGATWTKVNAGIIPAKGQGGAGASYAYTDNLPKQRVYQAWQYKVEEMSNTNERIAETTTETTK